MHADLIPFAVLSTVALGIAFLLRKQSRGIAVIFIGGGVAPLMAAISNTERWSVHFELELIAFYCSLPLLVIACWFVTTRKMVSGGRFVAFWLLFSVAIYISIYTSLWVLALSNL